MLQVQPSFACKNLGSFNHVGCAYLGFRSASCVLRHHRALGGSLGDRQRLVSTTFVFEQQCRKFCKECALQSGKVGLIRAQGTFRVASSSRRPQSSSTPDRASLFHVQFFFVPFCSVYSGIQGILKFAPRKPHPVHQIIGS
jgi:hypothetical protein